MEVGAKAQAPATEDVGWSDGEGEDLVEAVCVVDDPGGVSGDRFVGATLDAEPGGLEGVNGGGCKRDRSSGKDCSEDADTAVASQNGEEVDGSIRDNAGELG